MSLKGMKYFLTKPGGWFFFLSSRGLLNWMDDEAYIKREFRYSLGYEPDLEHPRTFNEKLNWLKLHDRNPLYTQLVDKYEVKRYVAEKVGEQFVVPVIGGPWDSVDEIDFDALPEQFVLKCTHDSGGVVICRDRASFDREAAKAKLAKSLRRNFYWVNREWPYKNVPPRIFAEKYLEDESGDLHDYKFFAFNGITRVFYITSGRSAGDRRTDFYDLRLNHLNLRDDDKNADVPPPAPARLEKMKGLADTLSRGIPCLRVDFYEIGGRVFIGELTLYYSGGFVPFSPREWDQLFGSWIDLPITNKNGV